MRNLQGRSISRRDLLAGSAGLAAAFAGAKAFGQEREKNPYRPFRMGMQSYSLRGYPVEEALAKTRDLGLVWWEAFPNHMPMTDDPKEIARYKTMLRDHGITMVTYGVVDFPNDEAKCRKTFEFGKAMGLKTFSAYPARDAFDLLDKLAPEYEINVAIHNHGPGDFMYARVDQEDKALKGHNQRIGVCCDTGHYLRSSEDPVEAVRRFGTRVYGVHLKDVMPDHKTFTEIGKGLLQTAPLLKILLDNGYPHRGIVSIEYEEHESDPISYIQECLTATQEAIRSIRKKAY